jgi:hypothetical protein
MKKFISGAVIVLGIFFFVAAISIFRPVPIVEEHKALQDEGYVTDIFATSNYDIFFKITDSDKVYYINRGLERGLHLDTLKAKLLGKKVILKYPKYWTPLDWDDDHKHISKVETCDEIIFNEFRGAKRIPNIR